MRTRTRTAGSSTFYLIKQCLSDCHVELSVSTNASIVLKTKIVHNIDWASDPMTKAKDEEIDNTDLKHLQFIDNRWLKGANNI